ncbi:unnamed protein product [Closterium sp. Naga37s-1]|nr:unnamed protein product [Closterium sp. Naga37s-1]
MTHGRQPHGCLLPALLTTRSARGGHFRQGGAEAALQQRWSAVWNGMVRHEEEADTSGNEPARRQGGGTSAEFGLEGAEQVSMRLLRRGGGTSGEEAARPARGEAEEREGVVDGLDEGMHDWDAVGMRNGDTALHAPPLPASVSPPDLHSVIIAFPPSRKAHGESTARRGEQQHRGESTHLLKANTLGEEWRRRHFRSAGEQQLGGSTPSPTFSAGRVGSAADGAPVSFVGSAEDGAAEDPHLPSPPLPSPPLTSPPLPSPPLPSPHLPSPPLTSPPLPSPPLPSPPLPSPPLPSPPLPSPPLPSRQFDMHNMRGEH